MVNRLIIGLEGHDGTGKSKTAKEIANLLNGHVFFSDEKTKMARQLVYADENLTNAEKNTRVEQIYQKESTRFEQELGDKELIIFDRTFLSHSVEENVLSMLDRKTGPCYSNGYFPKNVIKPELIFQVKIPEAEREKRVKNRNEKLSKRDVRLNEDDIYRQMLEQERTRNGCISLNLRLRDPKTCALRAAQVILGNKSVIPLSINLSSL